MNTMFRRIRVQMCMGASGQECTRVSVRVIVYVSVSLCVGACADVSIPTYECVSTCVCVCA